MSSTDDTTLFKGTFPLPSVKTFEAKIESICLGCSWGLRETTGSSFVGGSVDGWVALLESILAKHIKSHKNVQSL